MPGSYWNEAIETLPSDRIERLESERLQAQMAYLYANSDYFRAHFDQAGIKPQTIENRLEPLPALRPELAVEVAAIEPSLLELQDHFPGQAFLGARREGPDQR